MIKLEEHELYQEIVIFDGDLEIGIAEVDVGNKMLARFEIYKPYQDKGYGQQVVRMLMEQYGCNCLWVRADNDRAIHVYKKAGFKTVKPTMYLMEVKNKC